MKLKVLVLLASVGLLSGCGAGGDFSDLRAYMDEVNARPKGNIEPLPKFIPYESFTYQAAALRSPFQPPVKIEVVTRQKGSEEIKPDESRVKQFLEGFNIDTFQMVGLLRNDQSLYALVNGAGGVHRIKVGDYLGQNHGKVIAIDEGRVDVIEIVPDGDGGWLERPRTLSLRERS